MTVAGRRILGIDPGERRVGLAISDRAVEQDDPLRAGILHQLVMTARRRREFPEAESLQREALAVQRSSLGTDHQAVAYGLFSLGHLLVDSRGDLEEAEAHYMRNTWGSDSRKTAVEE